MLGLGRYCIDCEGYHTSRNMCSVLKVSGARVPGTYHWRAGTWIGGDVVK